MKKLVLIPAILFCLWGILPNLAGASGTGVLVFAADDDTGAIVLAKFQNPDFLPSEVDALANQLDLALQSFGIGPEEASVFNLQEFGIDPDSIRPQLQPLTSDFQILFLEISKGPAPVASAIGNNIWVDMYYENLGAYVGSLGFQEALTQMSF